MLTCPTCGARSYHEFWFGGELRPYDPDCTDDQHYGDTWLRVNVAGPQQERWFHYAGCRRWITVERDTRDNAITATVASDGGDPHECHRGERKVLVHDAPPVATRKSEEITARNPAVPTALYAGTPAPERDDRRG